MTVAFHRSRWRSALGVIACIAASGCGEGAAPSTVEAPVAEGSASLEGSTGSLEGSAGSPEGSASPEGSTGSPEGSAGSPEGSTAPPEGSAGSPEGSTASLGADAPPGPPHDVMLVVVHDEPLLRSELRVLSVITDRLDRRGLDVGQREATEAEATYFRHAFEGTSDGAWPSSLAGASQVVVLRIPAPRVLERGDRATRGIAGVLAYRAAEESPFVSVVVDDGSAWRQPEDRWSAWLLSLLHTEVAS